MSHLTSLTPLARSCLPPTHAFTTFRTWDARRRRQSHVVRVSKENGKGEGTVEEGSSTRPTKKPSLRAKEGPSADLGVIFSRLQGLATPYWVEGDQAKSAQLRLAGVLALTLGTTGVSVLFNFLGRDFFNALSAKDQAKFTEMLFKWLGALCLGIPVFVLRDYYQSRLALEWREWMTEQFTRNYFADRTFYRIQADSLLDNPDQRIAVDIRSFTDTTLAFGVTILNAAVDLISFSGILFSIYPPLFAALLIYSIGGTAASLAIGRPLIGLNFSQEAAEANFRYGLVRVRENAESIAFYGGEDNEARLLGSRLSLVVDNFGKLLLASRNLNFFTSFYRFLIQILPAAVVAPLYFRGEIEFGVINQSASAFNHILTDVSLVVYQFEALAGFSAVIDRLGELEEVLSSASASLAGPPSISLRTVPVASNAPLLVLDKLSLTIPHTEKTLIRDLSFAVEHGHSLLIMGPSGSGKTSLLRTIAGLWQSGSGSVILHGQPMGRGEGEGDVFFVPQRPYVVLGSLRDQLLYPTWAQPSGADSPAAGDPNHQHENPHRSLPSDEDMRRALLAVRLGPLVERVKGDLDAKAEWASVLSLGEQQRLAFARILLAKPRLVLMDESTSALDTSNEKQVYRALRDAGITYVSVGHRPTLLSFHQRVLLLHGNEEEGDGEKTSGSWELKPSSDVSLESAVTFMD